MRKLVRVLSEVKHYSIAAVCYSPDVRYGQSQVGCIFFLKGV
jgi:hypothetical protein